MRGTESSFRIPAGNIERAGSSMPPMDSEAGDTADGLLALALDRAMRDQPAEALPLFERLCVLEPQEPAHAINLGNARLACGDAMGAADAFARAGRLGSTGIEYWLGYGLAMLGSRNFPEAGALLQRAYQAQPEAADVVLGWVQYLVEMERLEEAHQCLTKVGAGGFAPMQRKHAAWLLAQCGHEEKALRLFDACLDASPGDAMLRLQFALLLERLNRLAETGEQLHAVGEVDASLAPLHALVASRWKRRSGHAREALACVRSGLSAMPGDEMSAQLHFEAAKLHDQMGEADAAMEALEDAHASARRAFVVRHPRVERTHLFGWLDERLDTEAPASWRQSLQNQGPRDPIFLVGFPRSGTTLLQHVLSMHPCIRAVEEKPVLEDVILRARIESAGGHALLRGLDSMDEDQLTRLRAAYWHGMAQHADVQADVGNLRLLDKYPLSLTRIPYIARLFPDSHTLCLLRHPCDVVLSCYMQAFGLNGGALAFSSLASTARAYVRVMSYWEEQKQQVGCRIHALRYEDLVADFRGVMQKLAGFLALPWCEAFEDFHRHAAQQTQRIRTPSYAQVTQPLNSQAVHRWQRYRRHFEGEALELLSPWVRRYGYSLACGEMP
jgi:tetratricopeptide (TPR) repeat protein